MYIPLTDADTITTLSDGAQVKLRSFNTPNGYCILAVADEGNGLWNKTHFTLTVPSEAIATQLVKDFQDGSLTYDKAKEYADLMAENPNLWRPRLIIVKLVPCAAYYTWRIKSERIRVMQIIFDHMDAAELFRDIKSPPPEIPAQHGGELFREYKLRVVVWEEQRKLHSAYMEALADPTKKPAFIDKYGKSFIEIIHENLITHKDYLPENG